MRKYLRVALTVALLATAGLAEAGWDEGVAAYQSGDFATAASEFRTVVEESPDFAGAHFMLGQALLKQNDDAGALNHLRKAYELDGEKVSHQIALAQAYLNTRRFGDANQLLSRIDPNSLPAKSREAYYEMQGAAAAGSGDTGRALQSYKKQTEANPQNADAWYRYGSAAFNAGDTATGVSALERAVSLDGADRKKVEALSKALVRQARELQGTAKKTAYNKAVTVAENLVADNPSYENLLFLGEVQLGAAKYRDAVDSLKQAAAKNGSAWYPHFYMSQAHTLLSNYDAAASSAQLALERVNSDDNRKRIWDTIGFAHEKQKNYDQAIEAYQKAANSAGVERVSENKRIAQENEEIEDENRQIQQMEEERKRLEEELRDLGGPPRR